MISLIIPVFNVEEYLEQCLESIIEQSFSDYEVILVDDGSTDKSMEIIREYKKRFNQVKVLSQRNKGVSEARNLALKYAKGEYVLYIDSDDFLRFNMLEIMVNKANKTNADIVMCNYNLYYGVNNKNNRMVSYNVLEDKIYSSSEVIDMILNFNIQGQLWNKLFKRSLLLENNFEFESGRYIQDIFPVFKVINNSNKIVFINEDLYCYRQRDTSTIHKNHAMTSIIQYIIKNNLQVNSNSFKVFRASVLSYFIYHYTNTDINRNYRDFKKSKYADLEVKFKDFMFLKSLNKIDKLRLLLWKLRIFNLVKKLKNKI